MYYNLLICAFLYIGNFARVWFQEANIQTMFGFVSESQPSLALKESMLLFIQMRTIWTKRLTTDEDILSLKEYTSEWYSHKKQNLPWLSETNLGKRLL